MSESKEDVLEQLKRHVAHAEPIQGEVTELVAADAPVEVAALFALAPGANVRDEWARGVDFQAAEIMGKIAYVSSEDEAIEAEIEGMFDGGQASTAAVALARAGIIWDHPVLMELMEREGSRRVAALIATAARPEEVADWLEDCEVVEDALDVLRAGALNLGAGIEEAVIHWKEALASVEEAGDDRARLDGLLAVVAPEEYARRVLRGDAEVDWLGDLPVVADFLQVHGPTEWLEVLGILEAVDDPALELASFLAVSAAAGIGYQEPSDEEAAQLLDLLAVEPGTDAEQWEPMATRLRLGFPVAVAPDEDLALLGAQLGAHERLLSYEIHSPGISGLPLSASFEEGLDLEASRALLNGAAELDELPEATVVAVVRTLSDLRGLIAREGGAFRSHAEDWVESFLTTDSRAIRLAVRQLLVPLDREAARREAKRLERPDAIEAALAFGTEFGDESAVVDALAEHARLEGPLGLDCARRLTAIGTDESLSALARLWESGDLFRVAFYRDCFLEALRYHG